LTHGKKILAWLLLAGGLLLLIAGSREFIQSRLSQEEVAGQWEQDLASRSLPAGPETPHGIPRKRPQFQRGDFMARMTIPRLGADLFIVEGVGKKELRRGPGHMIGTGFPGEPDNAIIAGHRDTHFRVLKDIRFGDNIIVQFDGDYLVYRVRQTTVVKPTDKKVLRPAAEARLTLITCYPFYYLGSAPKRFIVQAELTNRVSLDFRRDSAAAAAASVKLTP
jgi:sortase A